MSASDTSGTAQHQPIDHRNDVILRQLCPDAFGPYGFDGHRAHLLVRGMLMPQSLREALKKRFEEELTDRAAARFAKSLDRFNPSSVKLKAKTTGSPTPPLLSNQSDRGIWAEEATRNLVQLHAKRVPFKQIAAQIKGKQVKGCQEHFYRVMKVKKWKQLHNELRENHNGK